MKTVLKTQWQSKKIWVALLLGFTLSYGCNSNQDSTSGSQSDSSSTAPADSKKASGDELVAPKNPDGQNAAVGSVVKISSTEFDLKTKDQTLSIGLTDSLRIYATSPSSLTNIKTTSFVGAATKKQADGSDQAIEVLIFPEELRGLNEGSFMLDGDPNSKGPRMTNGSAARMSNGSVEKAEGSSLTVQYQGHSRTVNVPPNTPVVEYKITERKLNPGDKVLVLIKKSENGTYQTSKILFL